LNVSRLESGQIPINKAHFNVQELFAEAEAEVSPMNTTHRIGFTCSTPTMVFADREKIGQVLSNLVSNAVKYAKAGTQIQVNCGLSEDQVIISVRDKGIGIKPNDLKQVFDRYFRAETQGHISGFGIGLYLCAEIIKRHNGKIWAESTPDEGSTFYFSLPL
jgi:signal transduction histidine kinase